MALAGDIFQTESPSLLDRRPEATVRENAVRCFWADREAELAFQLEEI